MGEQLIISISREYGTGGHAIGVKVAEDLGIKLYDRNIVEEIAKEKGTTPEKLEGFDENGGPMFAKKFGRHSSSASDILAEMQFDFLRKKAEAGESFVVVGRCAETILKEYDCLYKFFVTGVKEAKVARVREIYCLENEDAVEKMNRHDKSRKKYHNAYSDFKWGDSRGYNMTINSSYLGVDETAAVIESYVKKAIEAQKTGKAEIN